ncbi:CBS domain-containing protein CBSX6 [Phragmites australis]|uniref:CBS domain-containing protein CBSX6 n=1 Tax=Phragmites australis TaxID=29695 RepID=UPI002D7A3F91|nr:CBS domain-containing protein CBSX6 [Phragmites australis]
MAAVFFHHVVGDLTVGKPEVAELHDTDTLEDAARAIAASPEGAVPVWRPRAAPDEPPSGARFIGMISALDISAFLAASGAGDRAMHAVVAEVVQHNPGLLREIDPGTRLIDALELMRHGVKRFLVRKSGTWTGITKRFSLLYNGKWLKNMESTSPSAASSSRQLPSFTNSAYKFCCLSREDVLRFLIGCLGALAPIPLTQISSLGAINPHYCHVEASAPAMEAIQKIPQDPCAVAVVETTPNGIRKILGDISTYKLWKCDYVSAAWALRNLSAGQFVIGADENMSTPISAVPEPPISSSPVEEIGPRPSPRAKKFSSRSIGFLNSQVNQMVVGRTRSMYHRGRSMPLMCKSTSSLAAVMAQMLSHRATHVWVTDPESEEDGILVGVVGYTEIFNAVTRSALPSPTTS